MRIRRIVVAAAAVVTLAVGGVPAQAAGTPAASPNVAWLSHTPTPASPVADPGIAGIAFLRYPGRPDVLFGDGPFGLGAWSLTDPVHPRQVGVLPAATLALPGEDATKGFWEGEHLTVDQSRHLVFLSRDPRAFGGTLNGGTPGIYVVDARDPAHLRVITFLPNPAGHTTACIDNCRYLWTGGPFRTIPPSYDGQPAWVTDMRDPRHPSTLPNPVDLGRDDGTTTYVHDTDVDAAGIAWTSGLGGVRGYYVNGVHRDPLTGRWRVASPADPVPYAGGKIISPNDASYDFDHNSLHVLRKLGHYPAGDLLLVTDEDFGDTCADAGRLLIVSLSGSYHGEGWRSTPDHPFRLTVVGDWGPVGSPGEQPNADCSAHWFDQLRGVGDGNIIVQAFYGQGTRFLDVSDPQHPRQVGYFVPAGTEAAAPAYHDGLVYAAQYSGGIDVLRFTPER